MQKIEKKKQIYFKDKNNQNCFGQLILFIYTW